MITALITIVCFLLYVLLGSIFIVGAFTITRGETEIMPDGTEKDSGKIGYFLYKPFTKKKKVVYMYKGEQLEAIVERINRMKDVKIEINGRNNCTLSFNEVAQSKITEIELSFGVKIIMYGNNIYQLFMEREEPKYDWHYTDPIITCVTCMASVWGSLVYWVGIAALIHFDVCKFDYFMFVGWVFYMLSLSYVNTSLWLILQNLRKNV